MPESLEDLIMVPPPTADRPLLGTIVLVVEDSRHACEGFRLICQRSGARIRRAESLASAERHLQTYRPRVAVVDLGLPDGSGLQLIEQLARGEPRIDGIIAISGDETLHEAAMMAGADIFLPKPVTSISHFQDVVLGLLPKDARPARIVRPAVDAVTPDPVALRDDLCLAADLLCKDPAPDTLTYVAAFLASLGKDAGDPSLTRISNQIEAGRHGTDPANSPRKLADRILQRIAALESV